ncbi:SixA phosphatase family protein [Aliarcobacter vitoriensis]|uniref:SixA phosphatase family protein n=1 Tax=Aliarcobacter vitoriensis TaxID=2011099 RepID=UPI003AAD2289
MKKLVLIRHAKSDWTNPLLNDFDRPLNKRGLKDAPFMAKILNKKCLNPDLIISSPSIRTKLTSEYFIKEFKYKESIVFEESIYEAPFENLLRILSNTDDKYKTIFLIGHNPGLNDLSNFVLNDFKENIPTCGILEIDFDIEFWKDISKENSKLICFEFPKKYS